MLQTWVWSQAQENLQEEEMATHSSILAWRVSWTEEPDLLQSMGPKRVRHNWVRPVSEYPLLLCLLSPSLTILQSLTPHFVLSSPTAAGRSSIHWAYNSPPGSEGHVVEPAQKHHMLSAWPPKASLVQHCPYFVQFFFIHLWWGKEDVGVWGVASVFQGWTIPVPPLGTQFFIFGTCSIDQTYFCYCVICYRKPNSNWLEHERGLTWFKQTRMLGYNDHQDCVCMCVCVCVCDSALRISLQAYPDPTTDGC